MEVNENSRKLLITSSRNFALFEESDRSCGVILWFGPTLLLQFCALFHLSVSPSLCLSYLCIYRNILTYNHHVIAPATIFYLPNIMAPSITAKFQMALNLIATLLVTGHFNDIKRKTEVRSRQSPVPATSLLLYWAAAAEDADV